ncbi:outer membrane lipoprotein carrier protein LolA [Gluconacetobacter diazotrophicus]|uniref:Outer membrane lipoprotein carrier protein LolA n=1 Tax=Gluconacetobacter diazotrophicus TaxID=33996 RepID=A0A7W4FCW8_GLUDI|nr:outer membrane lipoprotein carrier protein LolA [Gluconacetobacter diazotrophicus]MBB2155415.1 outer membrane lipoprotein carrier protein LolA [Gluconacetobacter diazotrophicus]
MTRPNRLFPLPTGVVCALLAGLACLPASLHAQTVATPAPTAMTLSLAPADRAWVQRVQDYLNGVTTLEAQFQQLAPDGKRTTGTAWLSRPGRMRFEYDKPSPLLLVANHGQVVFNDSQLGQTTTLPLDKTPLGLLLRPGLQLSGDVTVTGFTHSNGLVQVTLVRTASPADGSLTLVFHDSPMSLRSWSVVDAQGQETRVDLYNIRLGGGPLPDGLFDTEIGEQ